MTRSASRHRGRHVYLLLATALAGVATLARADVAVVQSTAPTATSWPGTPLVAVTTNPATQATVPESFQSWGGTHSLAQTFTVPAGQNYRLDKVLLYAGGGTGSSESAPVHVNLYPVQGGSALPASLTARTNLLGNGGDVSITYTTQANGILELDFSGDDRVLLVGGRAYALDLTGIAKTAPVMWSRTVAEGYADGQAYRDYAPFNSSPRDLAMALYATPTDEPVPPAIATVDGADLHQVMNGFGAGAAYLTAGADQLNDAQMDTLYGTTGKQLGLTWIRVRIEPDGTWKDGGSFTAAVYGKRAVDRGARILATPWTPPAEMKTNNSTTGGEILASAYADYAAYLNDFIDAMAAQGAPVSVISVQNEPDFVPPDYDGCKWTAQEIHDFAVQAAGALKAPLMIPESYNFALSMSDPSLNDPDSARNVAYIGNHLYGGTFKNYPLANQLRKPMWMTEYLVNDQTMATALATGTQIAESITVANLANYIWWKTVGNDNGLLNAAGVAQHRGYVMAQFSRFVRPGDIRVGITGDTSVLTACAFRSPADGRFAIVVVNGGASPVYQQFDLASLPATQVTPWITSETQDLEEQAPVPVTGGSFAYTVPAGSVVTFAGVTDRLEIRVLGTTLDGGTATVTVQTLGIARLTLWKAASPDGTFTQVPDAEVTYGDDTTTLTDPAAGPGPAFYTVQIAR